MCLWLFHLLLGPFPSYWVVLLISYMRVWSSLTVTYVLFSLLGSLFFSEGKQSRGGSGGRGEMAVDWEKWREGKLQSRCKLWEGERGSEGMEDTKTTGPSNSTWSKRTWTHRDWRNICRARMGLHQVLFISYRFQLSVFMGILSL